MSYDELYRMGLLSPQEHYALVSGTMPYMQQNFLMNEVHKRIEMRQRHYSPYGMHFRQEPRCKEFTGKPTKVLHIKVNP